MWVLDLIKKIFDVISIPFKFIINIFKENKSLKIENAELKRVADIESKLIRHQDTTYCTLPRESGINQNICAICWDKDHQIVQVIDNKCGSFKCKICGNHDVFDPNKKRIENEIRKREADENRRITSKFLNGR